MLSITEAWHKNIDECKQNVNLFGDPEKSFDTVDHDILLSKLSAPGVTKKAHCCFTSYLKTEHESAPQEAQIVAFLKDLVRSSYYFSYT